MKLERKKKMTGNGTQSKGGSGAGRLKEARCSPVLDLTVSAAWEMKLGYLGPAVADRSDF